ncbi:rhamnulose-1-phosphate aldolase [Salmonella enterica subsp. enterica]|uniref:Rhamnulose-1-phosphate aldolase n=1 Tax=Salmonella enterica I TaxID=59201 RepID=A0A379X340_SALET|nr:rhamnulose-1-phosphate aldolase [Salmonella enterica subsp. enterica]
MPLLANTPFIVTGSGKFFRNVQLDPAAILGVVKIDSDGAGYHILWGLTHDAVPPSELPGAFPFPLRTHQSHPRQRPRHYALPCD